MTNKSAHHLGFGAVAREAFHRPVESGVAYIGAGATSIVAGTLTCVHPLETAGFYLVGAGVERLYNFTDRLNCG